MVSQQIFEEERKRIFNHSWLYVGHESEVSKPGDFVRRSVGGRPLFMVRGAKSGRVNVFHNSCTHRGAMICRQKSGSAKSFPCFYHAWSFDSEGDLKGVPDRDGYGERLDFAQLGLKSPRVETYRGFVFATFDPDIVDLVNYLAGAREYLDLVIDSGDGEMEIVKGTNEYCMSANWKLLCENSIDGYHATSVHDTYFKYLVALGTDLRDGVQGTSHDLGNGHVVLEYEAPWGRPIAKWEPLFGDHARDEVAGLRAELVAKHGEDRTFRMADTNRNMLIYPNLVVNDIMAVTVRTFMPSAPNQMDITAWELAPKGELAALRQRRLDSFLTFLGPAGFATPDDVEALESCQQGFTSGGVEWSDISRGMAREQHGNDEGQMRVFWRRWAEQMGDAAYQKDQS
jgi:p-cumate 2,3-dioxygenase alpha subunit